MNRLIFNKLQNFEYINSEVYIDNVLCANNDFDEIVKDGEINSEVKYLLNGIGYKLISDQDFFHGDVNTVCAINNDVNSIGFPIPSKINLDFLLDFCLILLSKNFNLKDEIIVSEINYDNKKYDLDSMLKEFSKNNFFIVSQDRTKFKLPMFVLKAIEGI